MKSDKVMDAMDFLPEEMLLEADRVRQKRKMKWWKPLTATAACLVLIFGAMFIFAASGAKASNDKATMEMGSAMAPGVLKEDVLTDGEASGTAQTPVADDRKLIRTVNMEAETETLDTLMTALEEKITELQGYVEKRETHNGAMGIERRSRYVTMTIRIPAEKLDAFLSHVGNSAHVVSANETVDDITLTYVATESRMNALKTEEERLLELMKQAKDMGDLLQIEQRLTEVRYDLERITSQLLVYDNRVEYGTVELSVSEVREYTEVTEPETVGERIGAGLKNTLKSLGTFFTNLFVGFVVGLPYIAIVGVVLTAVMIIIRKKRKK